jgi:hypothetical protein
MDAVFLGKVERQNGRQEQRKSEYQATDLMVTFEHIESVLSPLPLSYHQVSQRGQKGT